jgi:hypothetical protein
VNPSERTFGIDGAMHYIANARKFRQALREDEARKDEAAKENQEREREAGK